jgi:methyl-accepting chemotaxis protein
LTTVSALAINDPECQLLSIISEYIQRLTQLANNCIDLSIGGKNAKAAALLDEQVPSNKLMQQVIDQLVQPNADKAQ